MLGKKVPVYGNGKNVREWIHVSDHVRAIAFLISHEANGGTYNIGAGNEIQNIQLVNQIIKKMGLDSSSVEFVEDRPGHDLRYSIKSNRLYDLGFKPVVDFLVGLSETISWYQQNVHWWSKQNKL
jgi:dTDP-glucose 4,6-dehydratase